MNRKEQERQAWRDTVAAFYGSGVWIDCARAYRRAHPLCERCLARHEISTAEEVHHKIKLAPGNINDPDVTLRWDNLEALCGDCHRKEHHKQRREERGQRRWTVDADGRVTV